MNYKKRFMWVIIFLFIIYGTIVTVSCTSSPERIGIVDGKLQPCPDKPNCVSSQSIKEGHKIAPLSYKGSAEEAKAKLKKVLASMPRVTIVKEDKNYIHAEAVTLIFRFVDDCEFLVDDSAKIIHVRSASRVGHSDLGVNRERVESIRKKFEADN